MDRKFKKDNTIYFYSLFTSQNRSVDRAAIDLIVPYTFDGGLPEKTKKNLHFIFSFHLNPLHHRYSFLHQLQQTTFENIVTTE